MVGSFVRGEVLADLIELTPSLVDRRGLLQAQAHDCTGSRFGSSGGLGVPENAGELLLARFPFGAGKHTRSDLD
jgi:hypothetical protein